MDELAPKYAAFLSLISTKIDRKRIYTDDLRRLAWGTDAGFYRLIPRVVVRTANESEVQCVLSAASSLNLPVTFRAAGTSLSGQAITDSILVVAGKEWENYRILDYNAGRIALQPGIIGAHVNEILKPYNRVFSPDPASKNSAMVGGIVANNASGMKCGVHANSDNTLIGIRIVLADGTVLNTLDKDSVLEFQRTHATLCEELTALHNEIIADQELSERIIHKYSIKNVTGLNIRPLLVYSDPIDMIAHCMVGSEGTLAFISEVYFATEEVKPFTSSAMVYFKSMEEACHAVVALRQANTLAACEMLDKKSLSAVNDTIGDGLTALLLQTEDISNEGLLKKNESTLKVLSKFDLFKPAHFSTDPKEVAEWWKMRSGIFPAVGGTRKLGTTVLIEDVAFHIEDLPQATVALAKLLEDCGYNDACIYGHCLEGNYHFIISQSFDTQSEIDRYTNLMHKIEKLVVDRFDGSLKAEHGTGRNMAPFVESEWGSKAWNIMKRLKKAFDPQNLLNPGVIFNDDPNCFIRGMKPLPLCDPEIDKCIECGFCEVNCVSCGLTLSARQRIVCSREIARLKASGEDSERLTRLQSQFQYYGNETCAGDGLCSTSCPMKINTGELIHKIRQNQMSNAGNKIGKWAGRHLAGISTGLRVTLGAASIAHKILGDKGVRVIGEELHRLGMPLWTPSLPKPFNGANMHSDAAVQTDRRVVYFPSCLNRTMGASDEAQQVQPLPEVFVELCHRAGYKVIFPDNLAKLCCGMIWESKGMPETADAKTAELETILLVASEGGKIPVVCDQSPCLHRMRDHIKSMPLYETAEFTLDFLVPQLSLHRLERTVAVHVTCSTRRMGIADKIIRLASLCAKHVVVPAEVGCCGFAGDKGFTHPELNAWGLRKLRPTIEASGATEGCSNSRTCEIGLTTNGGIPYKSIAYLVLEASEPIKN